MEAFSSDLIRFYYGQDMIGNEIGAAAKNVIGIAAGYAGWIWPDYFKGGIDVPGDKRDCQTDRSHGRQ